MDKKSGVYYYLTDSSVQAGGFSAFAGVVFMYTTKGEVGKLTTVTAQNYKDIIGYDVGYNQNYAGLDRMLSTVSKLEVLRCNLNPTVSYKVWSLDGDNVVAQDKLSYTTSDAVELSGGFDSVGTVWVSVNSPGTWSNNTYVCFSQGKFSNQFILHHYTLEAGKPFPLNSYEFSTDPEADDYYKKVYFGDLVFGYKDVFPLGIVQDVSGGLPTEVGFFRLWEGTNGEKAVSGSDISPFLRSLDSSKSNVVVMNGFVESSLDPEGKNIIQTIVDYASSQDKSVFIDAPVIVDPGTQALVAGDDLFEWAQSMLSPEGQYAQVAAVPDRVTVAGISVLIQPSVNLFLIYARMFGNYGHVNYPPAGPSYGVVSASNLMESNFALYGDDLKTNRINYLTSTSHGVCMWEYRTLYPKGASDLSYANTPFILRDLKGRLISFMENFSFRYTTPVDLLTIRSGLTSILDNFVQNYFLVGYTLTVPTFEEAQAAGRELDVGIDVAVINSADVISLRVNLRNAADLRAV